jgi:hypothetical protein
VKRLLRETRYLLALSLSWLWPLVAPAELEPLEGWLALDWPLEDPEPAEPLAEPLPDMEPEGLDEAPPPALFFSSGVVEAAPEEELELEGELDGEDGVLEGDEVEPDEDAEPDGDAPVLPAEPVLLSPQAARPRAKETAAARMESFMCSPPWLG